MNTTQHDGTHPTRLIKGLFSLPKFIRYIKERCPPRCFDDPALIAEWREARAEALNVMLEEAGAADCVAVQELPDDMKVLADQVLQQPSMHRVVSLVSRRWCLVEIDRLVVFQEAIDLHHVEEIKASLSACPNAQELIDLVSCNGAHAHPPVRCTPSDGGYMFSSASNDLRFLDVATVEPDAIAGFTPVGAASHAIVMYVGYSDNVISATRSDNRVILTNGSHRVYALRDLGVRYVPCLVTDASEGDVSEFLLPAAVKQDRAFYLTAPRPPMFKDYFDSRFTRTVPVIRKTSVLKAKLDLQKSSVPTV